MATRRVSAFTASLCAPGPTALAVGRLQERLRIAASTLSHHLKRLIEAGLVTQERQATTLVCRAHYPAMNALIGFLADECCADTGQGEEAADSAAVSFFADELR